MTYTVVLLRERDGRYSVVVPALPGCATWGEDLAQASRMAEEAILAYRDGLEELGREMPRDLVPVAVDLGEASEAIVCRIRVPEETTVA